MKDERLRRLSHWWREVETHSGDEELLKRKLHLLEAEIRHTLKLESRSPQQLLRSLAAFAMLLAILAVALAIAHSNGAIRPTAPALMARPLPPVATQDTLEKAIRPLPSGNTLTLPSGEVVKPEHPSRRARQVARAQARNVREAPEPVRAGPAPTGPVQPAASTAGEPPAPTRNEPALNPLELLTAFESAFEQEP